MTSNAGFYRVDTDLVLPQVSPETWTLRIDGMVDRPFELTFAELLKMPLTEADITLVCVSNQVGGTYNGNATWLGVPLAGLLRRAGCGRRRPGAVRRHRRDDHLHPGRRHHGRPERAAGRGDERPAAARRRAGFPARMIVPGLYGYVSATKWVTKLTLTTFARQKAYWTQRGYSARAPIKTESRIDVPKPLSQVKAGRHHGGGRGLGAGQGHRQGRGQRGQRPVADRATLAASGGIDTWRQWMWAGTPDPGCTTSGSGPPINSGATQTPQRAYPVPNGASGWDSVVVTVM